MICILFATVLLLTGSANAFQPTTNLPQSPISIRPNLYQPKLIPTLTNDRLSTLTAHRRKVYTLEKECETIVDANTNPIDTLSALSTISFLTATTVSPTVTNAAITAFDNSKSIFSQASMDPSKFSPVCPASDAFYRALQSSTAALVGPETFVEYGPLIAGGLLRIRLELCVVESFFQEAVGPFIEKNGLSWILPIHETVESFVAGVVFAVATTFILIGSTKIVTVIFTFTDLLVGLPLRTLGGFTYDRAAGKPITVDFGVGPWKKRIIGPPESDATNVSSNGEASQQPLALLKDLKNTGPLALIFILISGAVKVVGQALGLSREVLEAFDFFVGRYLVLLAGGYVLLKFLHFKIFPDFP